MKIQAKISPQIILEVDGETQKDVFDKLASASEIFGEKICGLCSCKELSFVKRTIDGNDYYELKCTNSECLAKLSIGQSKKNKGELFPKRKLISSGPQKGKPDTKNGQYGSHNGWTKWMGKSVEEDD